MYELLSTPKEMTDVQSQAVCAMETTNHGFENVIRNMELKMMDMHDHHIECLLRLKRRFLCTPEEVNCSDLEFWKIPDVPVEDECCGVDHCNSLE